jgi:hypothetical protein
MNEGLAGRPEELAHARGFRGKFAGLLIRTPLAKCSILRAQRYGHARGEGVRRNGLRAIPDGC